MVLVWRKNYLQGQAMLNAALHNPNLSAAERAAIQAQAQTCGLGAALGLLGGMVTAAAERMRKQEERAEQLAAAYRADSERIRAAADEIADEKRLDYHDPQLPKPAPSAPDWASFRAQEQANASLPPKEQPKPWWQRPLAYGAIIGGTVGGLVGGLLGGVPGLIGGAAVGATVGASWGSSQEGYIRTTRDILAQTDWKSRRPADFPAEPSQATDWLLRTMQTNANGPIGQTLRQTNREWGPLGRLVTVPIWIKLVEGNGPWDFKVEQRRDTNKGGWGWKELNKPMELAGLQVRRDAFANIHYGYVGRSLGYSRWFLELGAGVAQIKADHWKWKYWNTWFDDPVDNAAIRAGMDLYEKYTAQGKPIDEQALQEVLSDHPLVLCTATECQEP